MKKKLLTGLLTLLLSIILAFSSNSEVFAKVSSYGFTNTNSSYMYNQASNWWSIGEGSAKNGSAINVFAAAMSVFYGKRITPASVAKVAYESNLWDLTGATPENLIGSLTENNNFNGKLVLKAAGSNTSVRLSALASSFTKTTNGTTVVIARATGKNPFHNSEAGGHYVLILAYKSDGTCLVYDPAQSSASPRWGSAKTLFNQMSSNIMFWVISKGSGSNVEDLDIYQGIKKPEDPSPKTPDNDDDDTGTEPEGDCYDEYDNWLCGEINDDEEDPPVVDCEVDPSNEACGSGGRDSDGTSPDTADGSTRSVHANDIATKARLSAWPAVTASGKGYCYDKKGTNYYWNTSYADYHNRASCGDTVRKEYQKMLSDISITSTLASETHNVENYFAAIFNASGYSSNLLSELKSTTLLSWLEKHSLQKTAAELAYGDIIYKGGTFYIYVGDQGGNYGNVVVVVTEATVEGPYVETIDLTDSSLTVFRPIDKTSSGTPTPETTDPGEISQPTIEPQPEKENKTASKLAEVARNFAWPAINASGTGYCYNANNVAQSAYSVIDCYHYQKNEYKTALTATNNSADQTTLELEDFNASSNRFLKTALASAELSGDQSSISSDNTWEKVTGSLIKGDLVKRSGVNNLYVYIGDLGGTYGNFVGMNENGGLNPYVWNFSKTSGIETIYRLKNTGSGGSGGGEEEDEDEPPVTPPEDGTAIGDKAAEVAMSFSWPYTSYSTDNESVYGKCVSKYNGTKTKYSTFPKETSKSWKLAKYPTGTSCNNVITAAYADFIGVSGNSKMNKAYVSAVGFVRNVYAKIGVNIPYLNITDIRSKLANDSRWELVSTSADKNTSLLPGDLLVAKDSAGVYVGDYGDGYGKVAQAYYKKWTPRLTPVYYNGTYVFRLKSTVVATDGVGCSGLDSAAAEGNNKIAIEAVKMSWPMTTGDSSQIGKCETSGGFLTNFPTAYTYTEANTKITGKLKSASTLTKARTKTTCNKTFTNEFDEASKKYLFLSSVKPMEGFTYAVMKTAGVNWFEPETKTSELAIADIFTHLKADTEHFELVSKKVKNADNLKPGDILINSETKSKKTYSDMLIYVGGTYGKDCLGIYYGNVAKASSSETPHLQPIYYRINNSSSRSYFWVFRPKASAYDTYEEEDDDEEKPDPEGDCYDEDDNWLCGDPNIEDDDDENPDLTSDEKSCTDDPTQDKCLDWGNKIAAQAIKFSWPYTKYSLDELGVVNGTNYTKALGKCVNTQNALAAWPTPFKNGYDARDAQYSAPGCDKMAAPLYARYKGFSDKRSYSSLVTETGIYTEDIKKNYTRKVYNPTWDWDCIRFVNDVLKKLGIQTFASSPAGSINYKKTGWMKIGDYIKDDSAARTAYKNNKVLTTNQGIQLKPGDVVIRYDICATKNACGSGTTTLTIDGTTRYVRGGHIFIYTGELSFPYGDRAEGGANDYVGTIRDTWISDHIYNYGRGQVYRYVGTQQWNS